MSTTKAKAAPSKQACASVNRVIRELKDRAANCGPGKEFERLMLIADGVNAQNYRTVAWLEKVTLHE